MDMFSRNSVAMDGLESHIIPSSLVQLDPFNVNNQNQAIDGYTVLPTLHGEPVNGLQSEIQTDNRAVVIMDSDALTACLGKHVVKDVSFGSLHPISNDEFDEQCLAGTPIFGTSLANLLASRNGLQGTPSNYTISGPSVYPLESFRTCMSNDCSQAFNSSFGSSINYGCDELLENMNAKGDFDRFPTSIELGEKNTTGFQPFSSTENAEPNSWMSSQGVNVNSNNLYGSCKFSNELSLSLSTAAPSSVNGKNIPDQSSEISSGVTPRCGKSTRFGSELTSCNSKELSLSCGSNRAGQFSRVMPASKYFHVMQEILAQIARYSLENVDQMNSYAGGIKTRVNTPFSSCFPIERTINLTGCNESPNVNSRFEVQMDPALQRRALEAKRAQLLTLLQMVDDRYNQCLDEIHTVVSAFHAATELDPNIHTRFALQTISFLYKSLRERISNQILSIGVNSDSGCVTETEGSFETSYFQKQWTLQQLKKREQQLWRPQRGLPERSVSVLRAWMFQNFLHPYPKDAEKHLLAVKSGLTRNQVSNWFINARVRLWKPMIDEMYAEMNRRNAVHIEGPKCNQRSQMRTNGIQRFNVN